VVSWPNRLMRYVTKGLISKFDSVLCTNALSMKEGAGGMMTLGVKFKYGKVPLLG
jgi:hypothetical protein